MIVALLISSFSFSGRAQELRHTPTLTPLTRAQLFDVLRAGHRQIFNLEPSATRLAMAWAQVSFENDHGRKIYNFNLGNIGPLDRKTAYYINPLDKNRYVHFDDPVSGAEGYWRFIKRCPAALAMFEFGNPVEAAKRLRQCGYYEVDVSTYSRALSSLFYYALSILSREKNQHERSADAGSDR